LLVVSGVKYEIFAGIASEKRRPAAVTKAGAEFCRVVFLKAHGYCVNLVFSHKKLGANEMISAQFRRGTC